VKPALFSILTSPFTSAPPVKDTPPMTEKVMLAEMDNFETEN